MSFSNTLNVPAGSWCRSNRKRTEKERLGVSHAMGNKKGKSEVIVSRGYA